MEKIKLFLIFIFLLIFIGCKEERKYFLYKIKNNENKEQVYCEIEFIEKQNCNIMISRIINNTNENLIINSSSTRLKPIYLKNNKYDTILGFYHYSIDMKFLIEGKVELFTDNDTFFTKNDLKFIDSIKDYMYLNDTVYYKIENRLTDSMLNIFNDTILKYPNVYIPEFFRQSTILNKYDTICNITILRKNLPDSSLYKLFYEYRQLDYYDTLELQYVKNGIKGYKIWRDTIYTDTLIFGNIEF